MTKKDMAKAIADEMGLTQVQAGEIVQRVFDGITETLLNEGRIELRNFGVFEVKKRRPRRARNPRTGENVSVPAKLVWPLRSYVLSPWSSAARAGILRTFPGSSSRWCTSRPIPSSGR